jgi:hypothetical protein
MSEENKEEVKYYALNQGELVVLQEFVGSLNLPWKQTNPYMQLLTTIAKREIKMAQPEPEPVPSE